VAAWSTGKPVLSESPHSWHVRDEGADPWGYFRVHPVGPAAERRGANLGCRGDCAEGSMNGHRKLVHRAPRVEMRRTQNRTVHFRTEWKAGPEQTASMGAPGLFDDFIVAQRSRVGKSAGAAGHSVAGATGQSACGKLQLAKTVRSARIYSTACWEPISFIERSSASETTFSLRLDGLSQADCLSGSRCYLTSATGRERRSARFWRRVVCDGLGWLQTPYNFGSAAGSGSWCRLELEYTTARAIPW